METLDIVKTVCAVVGAITGSWSLGWQYRKDRAAKVAKPKVSTRIPNAPFEISYGIQGPVLFMALSYRTEIKSAFVDRVEAVFKNTQTSETHILEAQNFLEYRPDPTGQNIMPQPSITSPFAPFGITMERYENKIFLFSDPIISEQINEDIAKILPLRGETIRKLPFEIDGQILQPEEIQEYNRVIDEYNKNLAVSEAWTHIRDAMYLRAGHYDVTIRSYVEDQIVETQFSVEITKEQAELLRYNALAMTSLVHYFMRPNQYLSIYPRIMRDQNQVQAVVKQMDASRPKISA